MNKSLHRATVIQGQFTMSRCCRIPLSVTQMVRAHDCGAKQCCGASIQLLIRDWEELETLRWQGMEAPGTGSKAISTHACMQFRYAIYRVTRHLQRGTQRNSPAMQEKHANFIRTAHSKPLSEINYECEVGFVKLLMKCYNPLSLFSF